MNFFNHFMGERVESGLPGSAVTVEFEVRWAQFRVIEGCSLTVGSRKSIDVFLFNIRRL